MSKYFGSVGYVMYNEAATDVYSEVAIERDYYGDIIKDTRRWQSSDHQSDNVNISNRISIVADPYAYENFQFIRYCTWNNVKWKVTDVEIAYPRLILSIGGLYNEQTRAQ